MKARVDGATLIHVDPRLTGTSAMSDIYAPIRAGSDIAFLGGLINHVVNDQRWNSDPFFKTFLLHYTNAATLIGDDYKDAEDADGVFSGLMEYKGGAPAWPYNGFVGQYDPKSWGYKRPGSGSSAQGGASADTARTGEGPCLTGEVPESHACGRDEADSSSPGGAPSGSQSPA